MNKILHYIGLTIIFTLCSLPSFANDIINGYVEKINKERKRIDLIDRTEDQYVRLTSDLQSDQATQTYLTSTSEIVDRILTNLSLSDAMKIDQLRRVEQILRDVDTRNVHFYTQFKPILDLIQKVQQVKQTDRLNAILRSNVYASLNLIAFYIDEPVAEPFFKSAVHIEPEELLLHYKEFDYKPFSVKILDEVARVAPMKIKTFLHSWNPVHQRIKTSENRLTKEIYDIYKRKGAATKAYVLINDIHNGKLSIDEAHDIGKYDSTLFEYLISMRAEDETLIGEHSVNEALKYQCLRRVRVINDLHEESDAVRFASLKKYNAEEIYTLMVYSEDEIYTSTFLGMYKRMMSKMTAESTYEFLHHLRFNKFRTFIKMAAGYNELNHFLAKMTAYEKSRLFKKLVSGLENTNDNLESAVAIADTYGSLRSEENKKLMHDATLTYFEEVRYTEAEKLYQLLLDIFEVGSSTAENSGELNSTTSHLKTLSIDRLFKSDKNVQQHFFFDDEDGRASYAHFLATFRNGKWTVEDKETYIILKSVGGKDIEIYANKPTTEYAGQDAIKAHFKETGRWPDVVVHRGHSYYADAAIESLTPNVEIVFLGSCGGYNNIAQVLKYSPEAQIISSKQIGTMLVNDKLCITLNEVIRQGKDIVWDDLWSSLDRKFANGSTADQRFQDYIPPHKNLGALLIKTYQGML